MIVVNARVDRRFRGLPVILPALAGVWLGGCAGPFADDPMLAISIPPQRLREVVPLDLATVAPPVDAGGAHGAAQPARLEVTIEQCRAMVLAHNLELDVELLTPTIARQRISEEEARFEAMLFGGASHARTDTPTASDLSGSQTDATRADLGVSVPLRTGGTLRFDLPVDRFKTDNAFATLNPAFSSDFAVSLSHNLLRNAGPRTNQHAIRVAHYASQAAEARTRLEVIRVIALADRMYWRLYATRQELAVRRQQHDLAVAQLERARRLVAAGAAAEVEVVRAEAGVAEGLESIIVAHNNVRDRERGLKRMLNVPDLPMTGPTELVPATPSNPVHFQLDVRPLVEAAMLGRMELLELELQLATDASTVDFERNQTLPLAVLDYAYNANGLGASFGDAFDMLNDRDFEDHRVAIRLEIPLGNEAARSRLRRALLDRLQRLATRRQRRAQIEQEVLNVVDQLEANWQRILANRQRAILAGRTLAAEQRQFGLGLSTSTDVLDAQTRLADARSAEARSLADYQIAQIDLAYATGTLLGAARIQWEPREPDLE